MTITDFLRKTLYQPTQPFSLTKSEFDEQWKCGSNFWVKQHKYDAVGKKGPPLTTTVYTCRMAMRRKEHGSGPREAESGPVKRRVTSGHIPVECPVRLRVVENHEDSTVSVELHSAYLRARRRKC
ncbi:hypothetical protein DFS34DRAFT_594423 [Phlyctochytrium arcticum]|nr:hypothetical protein DFS34DRAFT_594423 [Phlyctochytrium arcticum]